MLEKCDLYSYFSRPCKSQRWGVICGLLVWVRGKARQNRIILWALQGEVRSKSWPWLNGDTEGRQWLPRRIEWLSRENMRTGHGFPNTHWFNPFNVCTGTDNTTFYSKNHSLEEGICDSILHMKKLSSRDFHLFPPEVGKLETLNSVCFLSCSGASFEGDILELICSTKQ